MQYDYRCSFCQSEITVERSITDEEESPSCFMCHSIMIRKFAAPSIQFKGRGFYSTDK